MSNQRVRKLPQNQVLTTLTNLQQDVDAMRAGPQFVGGASILYFQSSTANAFDWTGTLNTSGTPGFGGKDFLITATAQNMDVFYGSAFVDIYAGSSSSLYDGIAYMNDTKAGAFALTPFFVDAPNNGSTPAVKAWILSLGGKNTVTLWLKFYVYGLDTATLSLTVLN